MKKNMDFIIVPRSIFETDAFEREPYSKREAFLDLVQMAAFERKEVYVAGHKYIAERGQVIVSKSFLVKRWRWNVDKVRRYLQYLERNHRCNSRCDHQCNQPITCISIVSYDSYQGGATTDTITHATTTATTDTTTPTTQYKEIIKKNKEEKKEKERDTDVSPKKVPIDFVFVKWLWNDSMKGKVPKIQAVSESRKEKIKLRVAEMGGWAEAEKILPECFKKINESEFCNGENDNKWVATFDWFFTNDKNWIKVSEGNYDNRQRKTQLEIMAENYKKASAYYEQRHRGYGDSPSPYGGQAGSGPDGPDEQ